MNFVRVVGVENTFWYATKHPSSACVYWNDLALQVVFKKRRRSCFASTIGILIEDFYLFVVSK